MFKQCRALLVGLVWVPTKFEQEFIAKKNEMGRERRLNAIIDFREVDPELTRPTYFEQNEFSSVFQTIVDTYGTPNFQEGNPAVFTCVTFPFLFAVMFGDVLHGSMLLAGAIYLCNAPRQKGSILEMMAPYRYFFLLMGIFAVFTGLIYNDFTSVPMYLFGDSCYTYSADSLTPAVKPDCVYAFGIDPSWYISKDELTYMNSLKMKLSVIFGVAHMSLGVCIKGLNAIHFGSATDFLFEFLPQIVTLLAMFGFMDMLIVLKWFTNYEGRTD